MQIEQSEVRTDHGGKFRAVVPAEQRPKVRIRQLDHSLWIQRQGIKNQKVLRSDMDRTLVISEKQHDGVAIPLSVWVIWGACRPTLLTPRAENRLGTPSEPEARCREVLEVVEVHRDPMRITELDDIAEIRLCCSYSVLCGRTVMTKRCECASKKRRKK